MVKSSYVWLIIVPVAATVLEPLRSPLDLTIFGEDITIALELPFRWKVFYFMAICFAIGQLVYAFRCPRVVREYADYSEFQKKHSGSRELAVRLSMWHRGDRTGGKIAARSIGHFVHSLAPSEAPAAERTAQIAQKLLARDMSKRETDAHCVELLAGLSSGHMNDLFDALRNAESRRRPIERAICGSAFAAGGLLLALIVAESFVTVMSL